MWKLQFYNMQIIYTDNTLDLLNLKRKLVVEEEYQTFLKFIKQVNTTPEEIILGKLEGKTIAKLNNEFPYDLPANVEHYLIWSTNTADTYIFETPAMFRIKLKDKSLFVFKYNLVAFFENIPAKKSVDLKHWHLIIRK